MARDITFDLINKLKTNGADCEAHAAGVASMTTFVDPMDGGAGAAAGAQLGHLYWFYRQVRNKGPWDFKNNDYLPDKAAGVIVCGTWYKNDMPGNFHFGFVGTAAGFSEKFLMQGAGWAQKRAGNSRPEFWCTFGDAPDDNEYIRLGVLLYRTVKLAVTASSLAHVLTLFSVKRCGPPPK